MNTRFFFIRTSKFWPRVIVLNFFRKFQPQLFLSCSYFQVLIRTTVKNNSKNIPNIPNLWLSSQINRKYRRSIDLNIWSISTLDTVDFEENNRTILLRKTNFAFMIPNPSLDCSYVILNFWANLSLVVLIKLFL